MIRLFLCVMLGAVPLLAQDAVNPCAVDTESLDCTSPGYKAEIDFRTIKLNNRRKSNPTVGGGQDLVLSTAIKYTKRGKAVVTTTFTGGCPNRVEEKRVKPPVDVTYSATLTNTGGSPIPYSGSGTEFTIPGVDLTASSAVLSVTYTASGDPACLTTPFPSATKVFTILVDDGTWFGNISAEIDSVGDDTEYKRGIVVPDGAYFLKNRGKRLKMTADFTNVLGQNPDNSDIVWTCEAVDGSGAVRPNVVPGTFTSGATGKTVRWLQDNTYQSDLLDDILIKATADGTSASFNLTVFAVDDMHVSLGINETKQFVVPESKIHPPTADKSIIEAILGQPEDVGTKTDGVKLRTREYTAPSNFAQLGDESFVPAELSQTLFNSLVINRATYKHIGNTLVLEVEADDDVGDYNITWESNRLLQARRFLHRVHATVGNNPTPGVLTLVIDGTNDPGPSRFVVGSALSLKALTSNINFGAGQPVWHVNGPAGHAVIPPAPGTVTHNFQFDQPGLYTVSVEEDGEIDEYEVYVYGIDLDIDSNNNNGFVAPELTPAEDAVEDIAGVLATPGKVIAVATGDADGDLIPDYADGWNMDGIGGNNDDSSVGSLFVPLVLTLPEPIDPTVATVRFDFDESPTFIVVNAGGFYNPGGFGHLRIWTADGGVIRNSAEVSAGGHGVFPLSTYVGTQLGFSAANRTVTLFLEAIHGSATIADQTIVVDLDYDGPGGQPIIHSDTVRVTATQVSITTSANRRTFRAGPPAMRNNPMQEALNVNTMPDIALTGGTVDWTWSHRVDTTPGNLWDDYNGEVRFQQDPGDPYNVNVVGDNDEDVIMRANFPGKADLNVTYNWGAYSVTDRKDLSVPQMYQLDYSHVHGGDTFQDDLESVGLRNPDIGPGPTQATAATNLLVENSVKLGILNHMFGKFNGINVTFTETPPAWFPAALTNTVHISGQAPDSWFGITRPNGGGCALASGAAAGIGLDVGNVRADDHCCVWSGEHGGMQWTIGGASRFAAAIANPINNSDIVMGAYTRLDIVNAETWFTALIGSTASHESGHALGLVPRLVDPDKFHNLGNTGGQMDGGGHQGWADRTTGNNFNAANTTRMQGILPTTAVPTFR